MRCLGRHIRDTDRLFLQSYYGFFDAFLGQQFFGVLSQGQRNSRGGSSANSPVHRPRHLRRDRLLPKWQSGPTVWLAAVAYFSNSSSKASSEPAYRSSDSLIGMPTPKSVRMRLRTSCPYSPPDTRPPTRTRSRQTAGAGRTWRLQERAAQLAHRRQLAASRSSCGISGSIDWPQATDSPAVPHRPKCLHSANVACDCVSSAT